MQGILVNDLKAQIATGNALLIVGAGVSVAATAGGPLAGLAKWKGLLVNGIDRCLEVGRPRPDQKWARRRREDLESDDLDDLLSVAELIAGRLGAPTGGEYSRWLDETVGRLQIVDRAVLDALRALAVTIATTNYDGLLEEATLLPPVTWRDRRAEGLVSGEESGILHLHGHWQDPDSVVLGIRSYEALLGDARAQALQQALRTLRTLIFIGFGAGLQDPNFGALLAWSRKAFAGSKHRHFRLCLKTEEKDLLALHPPAERIELVVYGEAHTELAPFLRSLRPQERESTAVRKIAGSQDRAPEKPVSPPRLPAPRNCFGRNKSLRQLVRAVIATTPEAVAILGLPGVGKTTVALTVLRDAKVVERYGARRFFVRCDAATNRDAIVAAMASAIGLEAGPGLEQRTFRELESGPALLVLDNLETPWDVDQLSVEELLGQLAALPDLALLATKRGEEWPAGPRWREPVLLRSLDLVSARKAFLEIAGYQHRDDPLLDRLIEAVDALPIAIDLLAHHAQSLAKLDELWQRWETKRDVVLQRAGGQAREVNIQVSIGLSLQSSRMTPGGRRLARLLTLVPGGLTAYHLRALLPDEGAEAAAALRRTGLVAPQEVRLRLLAPIREALRHLPSSRPKDREKLILIFLDLALRGEQVGHEGGADAVKELGAEIENLEAVIGMALQEGDLDAAVAAAVALGQFQRFTGLGGFGVLGQAIKAAKKAGNTALEARALEAFANVAAGRFDYQMARPRFEKAQALYHHLGDWQGEANCIWSLGNITLSDSEAAKSHFEKARRLYHRADSMEGEVNCIYGLTTIALVHHDYKTARPRLEEALALYRGIGDPLGEANCISSLGDIALEESDDQTARSRYEEALALYCEVGNLLGKANCIKGFGDLALHDSDYERARSKYERARLLYRQVGSALGEASCVQRLGRVAAASGDSQTARGIQDPYSTGWTHWELAQIASDPKQRRTHLQAARRAWSEIERSDLVARADRELAEGAKRRRTRIK
jgi:tetratricopeptide (TPR) repeat protein